MQKIAFYLLAILGTSLVTLGMPYPSGNGNNVDRTPRLNNPSVTQGQPIPPDGNNVDRTPRLNNPRVTQGQPISPDGNNVDRTPRLNNPSVTQGQPIPPVNVIAPQIVDDQGYIPIKSGSGPRCCNAFCNVVKLAGSCCCKFPKE
ncbi:uncharacterized protein LOC126843688 isoform X1 [Adelges cooleyi]|uniref:uncharacterized protein LOC126843688 isoform X1 n=1 Tax=Adelges cooleyi TaxID=133065 RepID=UPI00217F4002|nr:uncharacterized protein LOC126843688 isoform X1 [Adelges cooleyi]